jgi:RimJ/RimL family protein N-acetyltransferase
MNAADLVTERLRLTAVSVADLGAFHGLHSDPELYRLAPESMHPDLTHSVSVIGTFVDDWARWGLGYWSIRLRDTDRYVGCGGVRRSEANWNVYYRLSGAVWGRGYATETIRAAGPCAEAVEPGAILQAMVRPTNMASRAVAERLGMVYCGNQPDHAGVEDLVYQLPAALVH